MQETYDLDAPLDETAKKLIDAAGAGQSNMSPGWLTELGRLWGGTSVSRGSHSWRPARGPGCQSRCGNTFKTPNDPRRHLQISQTWHTASRAQDVPVADAKPEEIKELLGGALFKALYKWMVDSGPVYLLPTGEQGFLRSLQG